MRPAACGAHAAAGREMLNMNVKFILIVKRSNACFCTRALAARARAGRSARPPGHRDRITRTVRTILI
eukprot:COSAG02_NODE_75_length_41389_cov_106.665762_12_plen_68_part_00